jgi:hypothetical protein
MYYSGDMKKVNNVRTHNDFKALSRSEKTLFFETHLKEESILILSKAVASNIRTGEESGGYLELRGKRLSVVRQKNHHRKNAARAREAYETLAKASKSGKCTEMPIDTHFSDLVCAHYGLDIVFTDLSQILAAERKGSVKVKSLVAGLEEFGMGDVWNFIRYEAEEPIGRIVKERLDRLGEEHGFCPNPLEDYVMYKLFQWLKANVTKDAAAAKKAALEIVKGLNRDNLERIIRQYTDVQFMPFHTHARDSRSSVMDLVTTTRSTIELLFAPSNDFTSIDLRLSESDEMKGAVDLGVIYSFRPSVPLR